MVALVVGLGSIQLVRVTMLAEHQVGRVEVIVRLLRLVVAPVIIGMEAVVVVGAMVLVQGQHQLLLHILRHHIT